MEEKKTLSENEIKELANDELSKVSGGYVAGDICPECGLATLENDKYYNIVRCPRCKFEEGDSRSR